MEQNIVNIILYSLLYWIAFFGNRFFSGRWFSIGGILLFIYGFSSSTSIYFYMNSPFVYDEVYFEALFYLFLTSMLCFYPLIRLKEHRVKKINVGDNHNLIVIIATFLSLFLWIGTIESLLIILRTEVNSIGTIYENQDRISNIGSQASWLGGKSLMLNEYTELLIPIFLFYLLQFGRKYLWQIIGLICGVLTSVFVGFGNAERVTIVGVVFYVFIVYLFFKPVLSRGVNNLIKVIGISFLSIALLFLVVTTLVRFDSNVQNDYDLWTWVSLYTGEGAIRFSESMWDDMKVTSEGDASFSLIKKFTGFDTFTDNWKRREYWEVRQGIRTDIFYTFIGDWYSDLGFLLTIIFCLFISLILRGNLASVKYMEFRFENLIIVCVIAKILFLGFTYYTYKTYSVQLHALPSIGMAFFLFISRKFRFS